MPTHRTLWEPDTCDCALEYALDTARPDERRPVRIFALCEAHERVTTPAELHAALMAENPRKSLALAWLMEHYPQTMLVLDEDGTPSLNLGAFTFEMRGPREARVLVLTVPGLSPEQVHDAQRWCDATLGAGAVVVGR